MTAPATGTGAPSSSRWQGLIRRALGRVGRVGRVRRVGDAQTMLLALLCYVPALLAHPGKIPSDTKLYLYLDPGYLLRTGTKAWDTTQYGGWVPHQQIAYLWPAGPWYWVFDKLGVPDWIAQRLWIATLLLCAGLGARWLAKLLGLRPSAATVTALFYMLSPYVLPYISRTSVMLLPFAGLCWLIGLTIKASTSTSWRYPALFALVMLTVAAVNFTAIVMIAPGPILWLLDAVWRKTITLRRALLTSLKLGVLSIVVSLWWIVILSIQSKHGANVLGFSETLQAVSLTSLSTETLRGLGYWLFYIRDLGGPATSAATAYLTSSALVLITFIVLIGGFAGLTVVRWGARRYAALLVLVGTILAVSVHPIEAASPLMSPLADNSRSGLALSMRSSTRALPLNVLGFALGWGALVTVLLTAKLRPVRQPAKRGRTTNRRLPATSGSLIKWRAIAVPVVAGLLAVVNLPAMFTGDIVDPAISHDENPPNGWMEAAAALSATPSTARVLQLPGAPFGAYRWGFTVDPVLPGLTAKPLLNRDLLPLGSPGAMDLLYALDNRFQNGTVEPQAIAPVARLLGADTIFSPDDVAFDRFRTPRPEVTKAILTAPDVGLGATTGFGPTKANTPSLAMIDEDEVSNPLIGAPLPTTTVTQVTDPQTVIRAKTSTVIVVGSGDGLVDAAAAGMLDGSELIRYGADVTTESSPASNETGTQRTTGDPLAPSRIIITDSNRDRAEQWRSSRDTLGFTGDGTPGGGVSVLDSADARLAVFPHETRADETIAEQRGGLTATASAYGEPFAYRPENRAYMAVDDDPTTAWRVADRAPAAGAFITVTSPTPVNSLTLLQPNDVTTNRWITAVSVSYDGAPGRPEPLSDSSKQGAGQTITAPAPFRTARITIEATSGDGRGPFGQSAVGFATIRATDSTGSTIPPTTEVVRPPTTLENSSAGTELLGTPHVDYVFTRDRTSPTDRWRSDPEPSLIREVRVAAPAELTPTVTVRLDQRADDAVLSELFGMPSEADSGIATGSAVVPTGAATPATPKEGPKAGSVGSSPPALATSRLTGVAADGAYAAVDGNPQTAWVSSFGHFPGEPASGSLSIPLDDGTTIDHLQITQRLDPRFATIRSLTISGDGSTAGGGAPQTVDVPAPDVTGTSTVEFAPLSAPGITITIATTDGKTTIDRRSAEPTALPIAISEISGPGLQSRQLPATTDTGCRTDLLSFNGAPVGLRISASTSDLLAGKAVQAQLCGPVLGQSFGIEENQIPAGNYTLNSQPGSNTGLDIDRVALTSSSPIAGVQGSTPTVASTTTHDGNVVTVSGCADGCWLVNGEGYERGWTATSAGRSLGAPAQVDGGFNGWWLPAGEATRTVTLAFGPQRTLDFALLLTVLGVIGCVVLAITASRQRSSFIASEPKPLTVAYKPASSTSITVTWLMTSAVAALVISLKWGLIALVVSGVVLWARRRPAFLAVAGLGGLVLVAARMLWVLRRTRPAPDPNWTAFFEGLHRPALLAVVLLVGSALLDTERDPPPKPEA